MDKEVEKMVFELRKEEHDSDKSIELVKEVELHTPIVRSSGQFLQAQTYF